MVLTEAELKRYARQILLPEVEEEGQEKLLKAKVLIIGVGGLGSVISLYLTGAGVGKIGIVDSDVVEVSNLHRQILYASHEINKKKADLAQSRLLKLNPELEIKSYPLHVDKKNIMDLIQDYEIIIDATDNFSSRYLINDACYFANKIMVHGGISGFKGQVLVLKPKEGACFRCLFPEPSSPDLLPSPGATGLLGVLPGVIGLLQATETLKLILDVGESLMGKLMVYDTLEMSFRKIKVAKNKNCALCSARPIITKLVD